MNTPKYLILTAALSLSAQVMADNDVSTGDAAIGGGLGGAAGAAIGAEVGGRDVAIIGSAAGAALGTAVSTDKPRYRDSYRPRDS